jgi:hypothetical protein
MGSAILPLLGHTPRVRGGLQRPASAGVRIWAMTTTSYLLPPFYAPKNVGNRVDGPSQTGRIAHLRTAEFEW